MQASASPAPVATVAVASAPTELPHLSDAEIDATLERYAKAFRACVVAARETPAASVLDGRTVGVSMTVHPDGAVAHPKLSDAELVDTELGRCLEAESRKMQFPRFNGEPVRVLKLVTLLR